MDKQVICVDFDGVLHKYTSPWEANDIIPDDAVPGALAFLVRLIREDKYQVAIFSTRCAHRAGVDAMKEWLEVEMFSECFGEHIVDNVLNNLLFLSQKPVLAKCFIDDRAIPFRGTFPGMAEIDNFKTWYGK